MTDMTNPPAVVPPRRVYGRRRGRALRTGQQSLIDTLLPRLRVPLPENAEAKLDPRGLFPGAVEDCWLEIGFGAGEHLGFQAETHPQVGLIGCEVFEPGIARFLTEVAAKNLTNLRLFPDDARLLIAALAPQSLAMPPSRLLLPPHAAAARSRRRLTAVGCCALQMSTSQPARRPARGAGPRLRRRLVVHFTCWTSCKAPPTRCGTR